MSSADIETLRLKGENGDLEAMYKLGYALQQDVDPSNDIEGRDLLVRAAGMGSIDSAYYLGEAYLYGWKAWSQVDHEGNGEEGVRWMRRAADIAAGDPTATRIYSLLGQIYSGQFVHGLPYNLPERDDAEAANWFRLCAVGSDADGTAYCQAQLGTLLMATPGAEREGLDWLQKAAASGEPWSMHALGDAYSQGKVIPQDQVLALSWYERSAKWTKRVGVQNDLALDSETKAVLLRERMAPDEVARSEELVRQFNPQPIPR